MHTLAWLVWLIAAFLATILAPNPLYLLLIFLATTQVFLFCRGDSPLARSFGLFMRAGFIVFLGYILFSLVTVGGARGTTVLLDLPALRLPAWLGGVVLGGPISAEAMAWGATRGLMIWTLMVIFGTFNALVDHYRLLRLTPRSLFHAGLAVTIAVAFVPALLRSIGEISQAQRARGHRFGRPGSWVALAAPLLAGSLEKSLQLAETLDARGYGRTAVPDRALTRRQLGVLTALLLLGGGLFIWFYYGPDLALPGLALIGGGAGLLGMRLRTLGRMVQRSSYSHERWRRHDSLVALTSLASVLGLGLLRLFGIGGLIYFPFPQIVAPDFTIWAGLALLLLAAPILAPGVRNRPHPRRATRRRSIPRVATAQPDARPAPHLETQTCDDTMTR